MEELKILTAEEAKRLTQTSSYFRNSAYREIKEAAVHNRSSADVWIAHTPKEVYEELEKELTKNGYLITYSYSTDEQERSHKEVMNITW